MTVSYNKRFLKDLASITEKDRNKIEHFAFDEILTFKKSSEIIKLQKLSGYTNYYKIRFGNYRIGLSLVDEELIFERVLHRKEIYKMFP